MEPGVIVFLVVVAAVIVIGLIRIAYDCGKDTGRDKERERCRKLYQEHMVKCKRAAFVAVADVNGTRSELAFTANNKDLNLSFCVFDHMW